MILEILGWFRAVFFSLILATVLILFLNDSRPPFKRFSDVFLVNSERFKVVKDVVSSGMRPDTKGFKEVAADIH
jgi:hypothetical protein